MISSFHIFTSYLEELFFQANVSNGNSAFSLVNMISMLIYITVALPVPLCLQVTPPHLHPANCRAQQGQVKGNILLEQIQNGNYFHRCFPMTLSVT